MTNHCAHQYLTADFYQQLRHIALHRLVRQLGAQDAEDRIHDIFLAVWEAVDAGRVNSPEGLLLFTGGVLRHKIADEIRGRIMGRRHYGYEDTHSPVPERNPGPEELANSAELRNILLSRIQSLEPLDQQILERFYLLQQLPAQICAELQLSPTQFRLRKSRAKQKLAFLLSRHLSEPAS